METDLDLVTDFVDCRGFLRSILRAGSRNTEKRYQSG